MNAGRSLLPTSMTRKVPHCSNACTSCRRLKTRCEPTVDESDRCATCQRRGIACTWPPDGRTSKHQKRKPSALPPSVSETSSSSSEQRIVETTGAVSGVSPKALHPAAGTNSRSPDADPAWQGVRNFVLNVNGSRVYYPSWVKRPKLV
ncbi:hypothetical protein CALVIDRAFT_374547 [Calocera viscosa TUFC12733]|uniref:Zn(2)-C6 fungal-type domain-containing protein n=1 Tax=Calocera viscosa (strain TUFC12733) TaxID=1330018 RepID=A0A167GSZ3_CALVF|nr:hypothetical protein CALVIDRAFT_374547 [Calocera viscosa TUFC12733]